MNVLSLIFVTLALAEEPPPPPVFIEQMNCNIIIVVDVKGKLVEKKLCPDNLEGESQ